MNRLEFLGMREEVMENIENIVDEFFIHVESEYHEERDELVIKLCDMVCETMDPVGLD